MSNTYQNEDISNATNVFCKYLLAYRMNYSQVSANNLSNFKRTNTGVYVEYYKCLTSTLKTELKVESVASYLYKLFLQIGDNGIKYHSYVILNDLIKNVFKIGQTSLKEEINQLKEINDAYKQNQNHLVIEKIDELLTDEINIDLIDVDSIINEVTTVLETQLNGNAENSTVNINESQRNSQVNLQSQPLNSVLLIQTGNAQQTSNVTTAQHTSNIPTAQSSQLNTNLFENMRELLMQTFNMHNNNLRDDISNNIDKKLLEFGSLMVTNQMAEQYLNDIEDLMVKYMRVENNMKIIVSHRCQNSSVGYFTSEIPTSTITG